MVAFLLDLALVAFLAFLALCAFVWFVQTKLVFPAGGAMVRTPGDMGWAFEDIRLHVSGETTHGWYMPLVERGATVLLSHGNAGTIDERLDLCPLFRRLGCNVLLYDYGGYGNSTGKPSERRCYEDVRAMWRWLTEERGIGPKDIIIYGRSLGCGPSIRLAVEMEARGLVLESGFTSIAAMVRQIFPGVPLDLLIRHRFDNVREMPKVRCPVLVMHSPDDDIVPFVQGRELFEVANEPKRFVELQGDHNTGHFDSTDRVAAGLDWLLSPGDQPS